MLYYKLQITKKTEEKGKNKMKNILTLKTLATVEKKRELCFIKQKKIF